MSELTTAARPYARAVYELAMAEDTQKEWSASLELIEAVAINESMTQLLNNPKLTTSQVAGLFLEICGDKLAKGAQNLVKLLAENGRLTVVPELRVMYEQSISEAAGSIDASVISALPLDDKQQATLAASLSKRLGREVKLDCSVDESLLGGVIVHAGDLVIDGSLKGRLEKLTSTLTH